MLQIRFSGWFQCRLATDPDPSDEPRGISGFSCAVADEPDLDRVVRLQPDGTSPRSFCPSIGVMVRDVLLDDKPLSAERSLIGQPVNLLPVDGIGKPVFEGRNGLAYEDEGEPIYPFHLQVGAGSVALRAQHRDAETGDWGLTSPHRIQRDAPSLRQAAGVGTPAEYLEKRMAALTEARKQLPPFTPYGSTSPAAVGLDMRIKHLTWLGKTGLIGMFLSYAMHYQIVLDRPEWTKDVETTLGITPSAHPWICTFWVGVWDHDALSGFMKGTLEIPVAARIKST